jgi:ribosome-associated heat shock protein Hsp15
VSDGDTARVDHWLWAVRLYRSRSLATDACKGGHVKVNGRPAKPASPVRVGDTVEARAAGRDRVVEVVRIIDKRVGAPIAAECIVDHSPPPPPREQYVPPLFSRARGTGRPTKKERRSLDKFRNR